MKRQKLRIAVVTSFFPTRERPHDGRPTYELVKRLAELASIDVYCPVPRYPRWMQPRNFDYARVDTSHSIPGISVHYLEFPAIPLLGRPWSGISCCRRLLGPLRSRTPDVILNYWIYPQGYAAVEAGRKLGIPAIVGAIGSDLNNIPEAVTSFWVRRTLQRANSVTCKSTALAKRAISLGASAANVHTIGNGCDTAIFHPADRTEARARLGLSPEDKLILFVGRLEKAKGLMELVEATFHLSQQRRNLILGFIGEGTAREEISKKLDALGIAERARFVSGLPPSGVAQWLAAANLLALPSYAEGCPNVVLEALSCGRPVVASMVGAVPELVSDECGLLIEPRDVNALANALDAALSRDWDEERIASKFRRSWDQMARETYDLCVSLAEQRQGKTTFVGATGAAR